MRMKKRDNVIARFARVSNAKVLIKLQKVTSVVNFRPLTTFGVLKSGPTSVPQCHQNVPNLQLLRNFSAIYLYIKRARTISLPNYPEHKHFCGICRL